MQPTAYIANIRCLMGPCFEQFNTPKRKKGGKYFWGIPPFLFELSYLYSLFFKNDQQIFIIVL